jgi:hypothetical protein
VRRPDLAESLQTNLDSHVCGYSCGGVATGPRTGRSCGDPISRGGVALAMISVDLSRTG